MRGARRITLLRHRVWHLGAALRDSRLCPAMITGTSVLGTFLKGRKPTGEVPRVLGGFPGGGGS